ncbi:MAG: hypothetical protein ABWY57_06990 [Mycetocola sp.]
MSSQSETVELGLGETGLDPGCDGCGERHRSGCGGCSGDCSSGASERPRWFAGQLVGPADLESLEQWVIGRSRRHNRMLHGWGVSCGLTVTPTLERSTGEPVPWSLTVGAGYGLSSCGDEISVQSPVRVDVRSSRPAGDDVCAPPVDPWCAPVRHRRDPQRTYYLAIRYSEGLGRPVRSSACGCGCDEECEFSRITEGFSLAILDELPPCHEGFESFGHENGRAVPIGTADSTDDRLEATRCTPRMAQYGTRPCPECCSPWLVLADLNIDANGAVTIDPLAHRRFLVSFGSVGFTCSSSDDGEGKRNLTGVEREVIKTAFAAKEADIANSPDGATILAAPAVTLRGAQRGGAIKDLLRDRTVAELAQSDIEALAAVAAGSGVDVQELRRLHETAQLVTRVIRR